LCRGYVYTAVSMTHTYVGVEHAENMTYLYCVTMIQGHIT